MKIKTAFVLAVTVLLFVASSYAGDFATLDPIGFSKDGRYLAYEEFGTQDGSGFPYSSIYFIDTGKNAYAAAAVKVTIENESGTENKARSRASLLAAKKLKQFGIVKGNVGTLVLSHLLTDLSLDDERKNSGPAVIRFTEAVGSFYHRGEYELLLNPIPIKTKDCDVYEQDTYLLDLKLIDREEDKTSVLQKDTDLPASRGCALSYRIQDVYLYKDTITVFLNVYTPGFEGPDMRYLAVAGKLK